jgi:hypothetical protein
VGVKEMAKLYRNLNPKMREISTIEIFSKKLALK